MNTDAREFMMKNGDEISGPFDAAALSRALQVGDIRPTALIRAKGQSEWRPIGEVESEWRSGDEPAQPREEDHGSLGLGLVLGFSLGIIGVVGAYAAKAYPSTKRGALIGFAVQALLGILLAIGLASSR
jgi:hypothetical protein